MIHPKSFTATVAVNFALLLTLGSQASAAPICKTIFAESTTVMSEPELNSAIKNLASLLVTLDAAQAEGISSIAITAQKTDYSNKEQALLKYVENNSVMSKAELRTKISAAISEYQNKINQQKEAQRKIEEQEKKQEKETKRALEKVVDGTKGIFHPVRPGIFDMGISPEALGPQHPVAYIQVELTKPFEMMATTVTQTMWQSVANLANSKYSAQLVTDPSVRKGPLKPVESVGPETIDSWLQNLNQLSTDGIPLEHVLHGHKPGDKYRLPTEAEWEFVITKRGQSKDRFFFGNDLKDLEKYAWITSNANYTTHNVAQKLPLEFDGLEFYDMLGNVNEFMADTTIGYKNGRGGTDPLFKQQGQPTVLRGLSFAHDFNRYSSYTTAWSTGGIAFAGFRLVREARDNGSTP